jgi:streptogramin lyase
MDTHNSRSVRSLDPLVAIRSIADSRFALLATVAFLFATLSLVFVQAQTDPPSGTSLLPAGVLAADATQPSSLVDRQRYGFVVLSWQWPERFDVTQLHAGWYVDFTRPGCRVSPEGMDRTLGISVMDYTTIPPWLGSLVDNHPGTTWLIGNEPDGWLDDRLPEQYAHDYHDLYEFIKGRDATALVAAANIVQPTPARLAWLDQVLTAYQQAYSQSMPVDLWGIHNMILTEVESWGCGIPPGIDPALGISRTIQDNDSIPIFTQQIWAFRQWMADRGYQGYPLIVTEYGILMPWEYGFTSDRVNSFMDATFAWMATVTDTQLGDPSDGYRLVQRWAWYSLDDQMWDWQTGVGFNGNLFDPDTTEITVFGGHFATHTSSFPPLSYVDLVFSRLWAQPPPVLPGPTGTMTLTLLVEVQNVGTVDSGEFRVAVSYVSYDGSVSGSLDQTADGIPGASSRWISFTLSDLPVGRYAISGMIDADQQVAESTECNNSLSGMAAAPANRFALPLVVKHYSGAVQGKRSEQKRAAGDGVASQGYKEWLVPTPNSYPAQIAINPADGIVWISERDGNRIARFDPQTGTFVEYTVPMTDSQPWGLVVDGSGDVWFAEMAGNQIGRFDPQAETFVEYPVPTPASEPRDVAVHGTTGNIWFTERAGNKIGKLEPGTGFVTEYNVPTANAQPGGLAIYGPRAWFAETVSNKLGRVSLSDGTIDETPPIHIPNSLPEDVVINYAGYPWVTEVQGNEISIFKVSTIYGFVPYTVPTPASEPYGIALASDGWTVWFTERAGNQLGRFDGAFAEFPLPTPDSSPTGIAIDSAGCAWYAAPTANQIGRFCPVYTFLPVILKNQ